MKTDNAVLKEACIILHISTDELEKKGGRDYRWGMIKKIKEAISKE